VDRSACYMARYGPKKEPGRGGAWAKRLRSSSLGLRHRRGAEPVIGDGEHVRHRDNSSEERAWWTWSRAHVPTDLRRA